jgi:hypothetical protein
MDFEPQSLKESGEYGVLKYWPNLVSAAYYKSSNEDLLYNCVAWVEGIKSKRIDFSQDEEGNLLDDYYLTSYPYIEYFESRGFVLCENGILETGIQKIAIFEKDNEFKHVAIQLENGYWSSKMGDFEDIVHYELNAVEGYPYKRKSFGKVAYYMKRPRPDNTPISSTLLVPLS